MKWIRSRAHPEILPDGISLFTMCSLTPFLLWIVTVLTLIQFSVRFFPNCVIFSLLLHRFLPRRTYKQTKQIQQNASNRGHILCRATLTGLNAQQRCCLHSSTCIRSHTLQRVLIHRSVMEWKSGVDCSETRRRIKSSRCTVSVVLYSAVTTQRTNRTLLLKGTLR